MVGKNEVSGNWSCRLISKPSRDKTPSSSLLKVSLFGNDSVFRGLDVLDVQRPIQCVLRQLQAVKRGGLDPPCTDVLVINMNLTSEPFLDAFRQGRQV